MLTHRAARKNISISAETRLRISKTMREKWQDGAYRARVTVNGSHSPERRAKIAAAIKKKWVDPEYRAKTTAAIRKSHMNETRRAARRAMGGPSEAARQKISEAMKRLWREPRYREAQLNKMGRPSSRNPETTFPRNGVSEATRQRYADEASSRRSAAGAAAAAV